MNKQVIIARLIPDSGKIHQNQEIYSGGGISCTIKATCYKDPPKVLINEQDNSVRKYV